MSKPSEGRHISQLSIIALVTPANLQSAYTRQSGDPIVSGDRLLLDQNPEGEWAEVVLFKWKGSLDPSEEGDYYQVVTRGRSHDLASLLAQRCRLDQTGVRPPQRLGTNMVYQVGAGAISRLEDFLRKPLVSSGSQTLNALDILSPISKAGYDIWLVGGAVRDIILREMGKQVSSKDKGMDVDLAGTIPFHQMNKVLRNVMNTFELKARLNDDKTVFILSRPIETGLKAIVEYAPLRKCNDDEGYKFDHDMKEDVIWRDLWMNCLFYDDFEHFLFDPTGLGLTDLTTDSLRPIDLPNPCPPGHAATTLFRLLKFVGRPEFAGSNLTLARNFVQTNLQICCADFAERDKIKIIRKFYNSAKEMDNDPDRDLIKQACNKLDPAIWITLNPLLP